MDDRRRQVSIEGQISRTELAAQCLSVRRREIEIFLRDRSPGQDVADVRSIGKGLSE